MWWVKPSRALREAAQKRGSLLLDSIRIQPIQLDPIWIPSDLCMTTEKLRLSASISVLVKWRG